MSDPLCTDHESPLTLADSQESSHNGSMPGYAVEARHTGREPMMLAGTPLDTRWRRVTFTEGTPVGVPRGPRYSVSMLDIANLYDYPAAQALRWWFHAEAAGIGGICVETRIVQYRIEYSHKWKPVSCHDHIHGEDRSNCMPDWGKKDG